jgi:hypothetical protein
VINFFPYSTNTVEYQYEYSRIVRGPRFCPWRNARHGCQENDDEEEEERVPPSREREKEN